ncbi:MAG: hypothetical protein QOG18_1129 [Microbacteriaceae bacterium]|jgi:hypothetical protein|nr:hypothetical protein [Microbacteriaceae bacterium]MDQ1526516.1 hypothetical protein [Microbacteriaceae bacterium]
MTLIEQMEQVQRHRRGTALRFVAGAIAGVGAWLTAPWGIVEVSRGNVWGWLLTAIGVALAIAAVVAIVSGVRRAATPTPGRVLATFGQVPPPPNPRPGLGWTGTGMDPRTFDGLRDPEPGGSRGSRH